MSDVRVDLAIENHVAWITLRRPEKLNALDDAMTEALRNACRAIERSHARIAVLSGEGGKSFCAGGDIEAWSGLDSESFARRWIRDGHDAFDGLARLAVPLVAVLNGHVLGGGLELAACADLRIAEAHVKIGQTEPALGIIPGWSGTQRAARRFGAQRVRRMALFGEIYGAEEALLAGLVDQVVPTGEGLATAERVAARVLDRSPRATELTKMLINAAEGEERERVLEAVAGAVAAGSDDLTEGLAAFREKRPPRFRR